MFRDCRQLIFAPAKENEAPSASSTDLKAYKCEFCREAFPSDIELYFHKKQHFRQLKKNKEEILNLNNHYCWTCIKKFKMRSGLISHIKTCHFLSSKDAWRVERPIFICNDCSCIFFNKQMLALHITSIHKSYNMSNVQLQCPKCPKWIRPQYIWGHMIRHDIVSLYVCPICFTKCKDWADVQNHVAMHPPYLHCHICNLDFDKMAAYKKHFETHQSSKQIDPDENVTANALKYFEPTMDPVWKYHKIQPYRGLKIQEQFKICILCQEICSSEQECTEHILNYHISKPKEEDKLRYVCTCGEYFEHNILLKQHVFKLKNSEFVHEALTVVESVVDLSENDIDMCNGESQIIIIQQ